MLLEVAANYLPTCKSVKSPHVTLTYAQSIDARISAGPGIRTRISSVETMRMTHMLRANHDAILVGRKTLEADNPSLNCRKYAEAHRNPQPIILDRKLSWQAHLGEWQLLQSPTCKRPWVLTMLSAQAIKESPSAQAIINFGGRVVPIESLEWPDILNYLNSQDIFSLLVEGGGEIIASVLKARCAHTLIVTIAPIFIGSNGVEAVSPQQLDLENVQWCQEKDQEDVVIFGVFKCDG